MVQQHVLIGPNNYNEVIVDAAMWKKSLPRSIEAVYYTSRDGKEQAQGVQEAITKHFKIPASRIPLLKLDLKAEWPFHFAG